MATAKKQTYGKPLGKTETMTRLAEGTGLTKKQVAAVFEALGDLIAKELGKKGPGVFNVPGLMKVKVVDKPATKATTRPDPFNPGQMMTVKAKPASRRVKVLALKGLKDRV
jgi:nucleoid DNA-binding protein